MGYQSIYNQLRASGLTEAGALALLGNWDCESNCESNRLQGDFSPYRNMSRQYTAGVDDGSMSKKQFMGDSKGFGLAQWTYWSRKAALYDFCKQRGASIASEEYQVQFAVAELVSDFKGLYEALLKSNDLYDLTSQVCYKFENPAIKNVQQRYDSAIRIKGQIDTKGGGDDPQPQPDPQPAPAPTSEYWPPRTICNGMKGKDVEVLCAVLKAREFGVNYVTDDFGSFIEEAVIKFQKSAFPDTPSEWDGIVGPKTWSKLFDMGVSR